MKKSNIFYHEICGAIHLHTRFSDGGASIPELIDAGTEVGLDYCIVTDHQSLEARERGYEGFHGNLLLLVGYEHQDSRDRNHYLVLGTGKLASETHDVQGYISEIKRAGGTGFIAHPAEKRHYFSALPSYPWTDWSVEGFDGIEIWNQMSDWVEHLTNWRSFIRIFFPRRLMADVPSELTAKWDELNRSRFVAGIGGVDAHTRRYGFGLIHITVFPVKVELKGIRTHCYLERPLSGMNADSAGRVIIDALRKGHSFVSNYRRGDARGSSFFVQYSDGSRCPPGMQPAKRAYPELLEVAVPESAEIVVVRNGGIFKRIHGRAECIPVDGKGLYRIEVRRKNHAWIYVNPFPLGDYPLS
ncbi:MAG: histidinol-phosphatase [Chitinivibrionales bacterium]|nr:histidinol-phosphatase [Chitinivibrionales bacterium]